MCAFVLRGRKVAYDNISVANATGRERTILGQTPSTEAHGGGTGGSTDPAGATSGASAKDFSNIVVASANNTTDPYDNMRDSAGSAVVTLAGERLG